MSKTNGESMLEKLKNLLKNEDNQSVASMPEKEKDKLDSESEKCDREQQLNILGENAINKVFSEEVQASKQADHEWKTKKPYTNDWERDALGYGAVEDRERELALRYPILIKHVYDENERFKTREEAIAVLSKRFRWMLPPLQLSEYQPADDEGIDPLNTFRRREVYSLVHKLYDYPTLTEYSITEEEAENNRRYVNNIRRRKREGDVQWEKYEYQSMEKR